MPRSGVRNVSAVEVLVLVTSRPALISSLRQTSTPLPTASLLPAQDHRIVEIDRTIGADCGSRTHGADHDHWLFALHCEVEEVGRLLDRVRAMRHDDTVDVVLREQLIDTFRERQPIIVGNALARDLIDLLATLVR